MNALEKIIRDVISTKQTAGEMISLADYMEIALQNPDYGYYRVRQPLGRTGDFVTSPEVSQMFGEMIGVWCAQTWRELGKPNPFALVELGPGRGTMMRDILRATANVGGFHEAKQLCLLDSDKALRAEQRAKLGADAPRYFDDVAQLPPIPAVILANEFFDALPVRQFEKGFRGWCERKVTVKDDALVSVLHALTAEENDLIPPEMRKRLPGTVVEISPKAQDIMHGLSRCLATHTGSMLIIDYGYTAPSGAATVQAVSNHAHADIFERPGEVDLTAHVDFTALAKEARDSGLAVSPVIGQGEFLKNMGIEIRADSLKKQATLPQAAALDAGLRRLIDDAQMGKLFKVMEVKG
ncbi:MAG: SAM-dependent methyltransferase [Alphaproteobacteria bacterium]